MIDLDPLKPLSDDLIDRIVDGELTPAELRAAIDRLDREPDAWKRCALAFLEAQCWRESLRGIGEPARLSVEPQVSPIPLVVAATGRKPRRWLHGSIMAASVAASFALGWVGHFSWQPSIGSSHTSQSLTKTMPVHQTNDPEPLAVVDPLRPTSRQSHQSPPNPPERVREVARLLISTETARAEVPILAGPGIDSEWVRNQPPPVSEHDQVVLQRQGYQVDQRRRLITTTLDDGRRVIVPIGQVQIRYTGNQPL